MKLSLYEQETIILYNQAEAAAEVYTHDPRLLEKLRRLAEKYPDQIVKKDRQTFLVPKRCVSVREPYSAERRKAASERAYELMERDLTVYIIQEGENPVMAFDTADLDAHDSIFALPREEWEESPEFDKLVKDRMDHQEEREQAFLSHKGDCFAIYQVKHTDELRDIRYEGLEWLQSIGRTVQRDNYELVYTAPLLPSDLKGDTTEQLFYRFNNEHPADYGHPSMSVSDIVAIKRDGKVSSFR